MADTEPEPLVDVESLMSAGENFKILVAFWTGVRTAFVDGGWSEYGAELATLHQMGVRFAFPPDST